jgi:hypothetical protein
MTEEKRHHLSEYGNDPDGPRPLPYSDYPKAKDVAQHGIQPLPASLPLEDVTTSPNGFLADKDSGGMFYIIRLA